jgi:hypothetical protein
LRAAKLDGTRNILQDSSNARKKARAHPKIAICVIVASFAALALGGSEQQKLETEHASLAGCGHTLSLTLRIPSGELKERTAPENKLV